MENVSQLLFNLELIIFTTVIVINLVKKNSHLVVSYILQSLSVAAMLFLEGLKRNSIELTIIALIVLLIKVIFAPHFFFNFVNKRHLNLLTSTYLSVPLTLLVILTIIFFAYSDVFSPLNSFINRGSTISMLIISSILNSIFILINRKGSLSQIIGILSLENSIVSLGIFLDLVQTFVIEIGILFNLIVWIVFAITFIELIYRNLKTTDVTELNKLTK